MKSTQKFPEKHTISVLAAYEFFSKLKQQKIDHKRVGGL
jgi:hypothetical protein